MEVAIYIKVSFKDPQTGEDVDFGLKMTLGETKEEVDYNELIKTISLKDLKAANLIPWLEDYELSFMTKEEYESDYDDYEELDV